jgi:hypothetical protein
MKKGQVVVFMIIGIIILILFGAIFYLTKTVTKDSLEVEETSDGLKPRIINFVGSCIKEVALPGIYLLGIQGGTLYPEDPTKVLITDNIINYGYLNGVEHFSLDKIEQDISSYVQDNIDTCLDDFSLFAKEGISFKRRKDGVATTVVEQDQVLVKLAYSGEFTKGDDVLRIDTYDEKLPIRLGRVFEEARGIVVSHRENPTKLNFVTNPDYFMSFHPFDETTILYSISDEKSVIDGAPFVFMFAIKDDEGNSAPDLDFISDFVVGKGREFVYQVSATDVDNDVLTFSSDNSRFPVVGDKLQFTANTVGEFEVTINVEDTKGLQDEQTFRIVVE